ncbi:MAG: type II toxin-antitoxin system VapB family antitoxin [Actinomycetales bacterium]|mgnify:FL=1|jgi:antitoxin VapB|uniref:Type II toxin-antitoxin system VapB family antitoxin n=1 Tax=Candidatus Phosphoribacter hodrii TaxID=2953743 RepID=A0A935CFV8_9MICO|nr:type II toxin-antitoxin system VapB family antitoxin [Candidatus Phosphoribacter hodrii]MBP8837914.1 type II toxin-antitoxin system VapB family antitoxin [Dermatophilaceae bacterium]OPZ55019.1 MAG: Rv0623-like transcription factor [bacterium ADurb.BinA028]MBK7272168.1 type II toxin-antitoxin system VapB family antitoxin [Candidatus Phosphoribacter hodrii]HNV14244.1 type II toxin-antitoxin system VapB family antitoxin [Dermatophilaceae bacterium]
MALNIKNERVCRLAKEAAERTGRSQVSVLEAALEDYLAKVSAADAAKQESRAARVARVHATVEAYNVGLTDEDRAAVWRFMNDEMYDEDGLPA